MTNVSHSSIILLFRLRTAQIRDLNSKGKWVVKCEMNDERCGDLTRDEWKMAARGTLLFMVYLERSRLNARS